MFCKPHRSSRRSSCAARSRAFAGWSTRSEGRPHDRDHASHDHAVRRPRSRLSRAGGFPSRSPSARSLRRPQARPGTAGGSPPNRSQAGPPPTPWRTWRCDYRPTWSASTWTSYHGGAAGLAELEDKFGALPATVLTTSRTDNSGIRLFRVRRTPRRGPARGVDMIQHGHRVPNGDPRSTPRAAPTSGSTAASGEVIDLPPEPGDLPELPWRWVEDSPRRAAGRRPTGQPPPTRWPSSSTTTPRSAGRRRSAGYGPSSLSGGPKASRVMTRCSRSVAGRRAKPLLVGTRRPTPSNC